MSDKDVIDLVQEKDGTYSPKNVPVKVKKKNRKKYSSNSVGQFFLGMDIGLDFIEDVKKRVNRIIKLRN